MGLFQLAVGTYSDNILLLNIHLSTNTIYTNILPPLFKIKIMYKKKLNDVYKTSIKDYKHIFVCKESQQNV